MPEPTELESDMLTLLRHVATVGATLSPQRAAWPYPTIEAFVLAHGRCWTLRPRPRGVRLGRQRQCYYNAAVRTLLSEDPRYGRDRRWVYCEGYARRALVPLPVLHAWVVERKTGLAVEQTFRLEPGEEVAYFGVPFDPDYLARTLAQNGVCGLLDRHETGWPLLTGADPASEAVLPWDAGARGTA